jgi:formylglycine-generating enzyme required for sulfatase activity
MMRLTLLALAILMPAAATATEPRIALVIGNSTYASGPLPNPANDAKLLGDTLKQLGFEVIVRRNADQITMKRAIQEFGTRLDKAGPEAIGLFYYAGHGVQLSGRNYLIPTTANIEREADVEIEAVSADWVIEQMRYARNRLNIVILDACRNNPFTRSMRSADRGLATMDAPAGILIAYSTAPGAVAEDGNGRNSPYTTALTKTMLELYAPVEQVFKHVRIDVMSATSGKQVPWESSSLTGDFYIRRDREKVVVRPAPAPTPAPAPAPAPPEPSTLSAFSAWVSGLFAPSVPVLPKPPAPPLPAGPSISGARALALLDSLGIQTSEIDSGHNYPLATIRHLIESAPRQVTLGSTTEQIRAALALCKQYSSACQLSWYGDEGLRSVTLAPLELDPAPVSVRAFRQFADSTHYRTRAEKVGFAYAVVPGSVRLEEVAGGSWRNGMKKHPVEDDSPVVGVSFQDAIAYCQSNGSRLPTEDEWEYVARGPKRTVYPWGDDAAPVARTMGLAPHVTDGPAQGIGGRYKGLSGHVWQWVDTRVGARRVLKGGSWLESNPANKRAATRRYELPGTADEDSGFRCARTVPAWPDTDFWLSQLQADQLKAQGH